MRRHWPSEPRRLKRRTVEQYRSEMERATFEFLEWRASADGFGVSFHMRKRLC